MPAVMFLDRLPALTSVTMDLSDFMIREDTWEWIMLPSNTTFRSKCHHLALCPNEPEEVDDIKLFPSLQSLVVLCYGDVDEALVSHH
jgi:hypothetical protein